MMDPIREELFHELSRRLASGQPAEQMARELDYQQSFLEQLLMGEDFKAFFAKGNPPAFKRWRRVREEEEVDQEVQHFLQGKALHNARALQKLADSGELKPGEEAGIRRDLMKMSGKIKDEVVTEVVKISSAHLEAMVSKGREITEN